MGVCLRGFDAVCSHCQADRSAAPADPRLLVPARASQAVHAGDARQPARPVPDQLADGLRTSAPRLPRPQDRQYPIGGPFH